MRNYPTDHVVLRVGSGVGIDDMGRVREGKGRGGENGQSVRMELREFTVVGTEILWTDEIYGGRFSLDKRMAQNDNLDTDG